MEGNTDATNRYESIYFYDSAKSEIDVTSPMKDDFSGSELEPMKEDFSGSELDNIEKRTPLPTNAQVFHISASSDEMPRSFNKGGGMGMGNSSKRLSASIKSITDSSLKAISRPLMIKSFPSKMRKKIEEIDMNGDGMLDKDEVENMIRQLEEEKDENTHLKYFILMLVGAIILIVLGSFGLTFAAINMSKETSVSDDDNGSVMRDKDSNDVIQTGVFGPDGTIRSLLTGAPMKTDAVASFTTFQELLAMPLEVIDQVSKFTFMTDDGKLRTYTKHGMELELDPPTVAENSTITQEKVLTVLLSKPHSHIVIRSDGRSLYTELDINLKTVTLAVKEPDQDELSSRRRALRELAVDSNGATSFSARQHNTCTKTGACLYTRQEIMFLHGITRRLDETPITAPNYVELKGIDQLQSDVSGWYDTVGSNPPTLLKTIVNTLTTIDIKYAGFESGEAINITSTLYANNVNMTLLAAKNVFEAYLDRNALFMQCSSKGTGLGGAPNLDTDPIKECLIFKVPVSLNIVIQETDVSYPTLTGDSRMFTRVFNRVLWTPQPSYAPTEIPTLTPTVTITAQPSFNSSIDPENGVNGRRSK